jgi:hypothetical protein
MAFGQGVAVMNIQRVNGHAVGQGGAGRRHFAAVKPKMGPMPPEGSGGKVTDNFRQLCSASADARPQGIQQAAPGLAADHFRKIVPLGFMDEIYAIGDGKCLRPVGK